MTAFFIIAFAGAWLIVSPLVLSTSGLSVLPVTTIWGAWHLIGFLGGWLGAFSVSAFAGLILAGPAFSVIVTWVYNHTRGSVPIAILSHGTSNAAASLGPKLLPAPAHMPAWVHQIRYSSGIGVLSYGVCAAAADRLHARPTWLCAPASGRGGG